MNKDYILGKLSCYNDLIEKVKHDGIFNEWQNYKNYRVQSDRALIASDKFDFIESKYKIKFPDYIKFFYSNIGCKESDFHYQINRMFNAENQSLIEYQYTEELATSIINEYLKMTVNNREIIHQEIKSFDKNGALITYESDLDYLLWEGLIFFNKEKNEFAIPFLQKIYNNLNSDPELIIENFFTWVHCGGGGGIVLNTLRSGYNAGEMWGEGLKITTKEKKYTYKSNFHINNCDFHLNEFVDLIESDIICLEKFLKKKNVC